MDKMREEFEAWCCKRGYTLKPAETNCGIIIEGAYGHPRVQLAWESWQESRSALCVELPDESSIWWHQDVCESLEEAGVPYK